MKRKTQELSKQERIATLDALYTAVNTLRGREAVKLFLRDLLTESERVMLGRRILIARMLLSGRSVLDIAKELRVGTDTVYRIERWLNDQFPGFEKVIQEMEREMERRKAAHRNPFGLSVMKRKYPMHFLLFNIADELRNSAKKRERARGRTEGRDFQNIDISKSQKSKVIDRRLPV